MDKLKRCPKCGSEEIFPIYYGNSTITNENTEKGMKIDFQCGDCGWKSKKSRKEVFCKKDYDYLTNLKASFTVWYGEGYAVEIDFKNRQAEWEKLMGFFQMEEDHIIDLTDSNLRCLNEGLKRCGVSNWEKRYDNLGVIDGHCWKVKLEFSAHSSVKEIKFSGINAYPDEWNRFCKLMEELFERPFQK